MTPNREYFASYKMFDKPEKVHLGDGRVVEAVGVGNIRLKMLFKVSRSKPATMYDVLHVPKLACNLFSVQAAKTKSNLARRNAGFETETGNCMEWGHWLESSTSWNVKSDAQLANRPRL